MSNSQDRMELLGVEVQARHGVLQSEKDSEQAFVIDTVIWGDFEQAQKDDDLDAALDYSALHERIRQTVVGCSFDLIEALSGHLCRMILSEFSVTEVSVTVTKVHPPIEDFRGTASVTLRRGQAWLKAISGTEKS